jgi:predicted GIY-YIG superfamily endonuclease
MRLCLSTGVASFGEYGQERSNEHKLGKLHQYTRGRRENALLVHRTTCIEIELRREAASMSVTFLRWTGRRLGRVVGLIMLVIIR